MKVKNLFSTLLISGLILACPLSVAAADEADDGVWTEEDAVVYEGSQYQVIPQDGVEFEGSWKKNSTGWWWERPDGTSPSGGIYTINGTNYGFNKEGYMITGWGYDEVPNYDETVTWRVYYYFDADGAMHYGWLKDGGKWYYLDTNYGNMYVSGIYNIKGVNYGFNNSGAMQTGWFSYKSPYAADTTPAEWGYCNADGTAYHGWLKDNGNWYYISNGYMLDNTVMREPNTLKYYAFNKSGAMYTSHGWAGIFNDDGTASDWYFVKDSSGELASGWVYAGGWYYLAQGRYASAPYMLTGWQDIDGETYYFNKDGLMATGWKEIYLDEYFPENSEKAWYSFAPSGAMRRGWYKDGSSWYYLDYYTGEMLKGAEQWVEADGKFSDFDENGKWLGYTQTEAAAE